VLSFLHAPDSIVDTLIKALCLLLQFWTAGVPTRDVVHKNTNVTSRPDRRQNTNHVLTWCNNETSLPFLPIALYAAEVTHRCSVAFRAPNKLLKLTDVLEITKEPLTAFVQPLWVWNNCITAGDVWKRNLSFLKYQSLQVIQSIVFNVRTDIYNTQKLAILHREWISVFCGLLSSKKKLRLFP